MAYPMSRREFLKHSGIVAGSLAFGGAFSGCASSTASLPLLNATRPVHYPKLPGHKIQSPEHYGFIEGCMTGIWDGRVGGASSRPAIAERRNYLLMKDILQDYKQKIEKFPSFVFLSYKWSGISDLSNDFPFGQATAAAELGVIPFISYEVRGAYWENTTQYSTTGIANGKADHLIINFAKNAKQFGDKYGGFFIRTMREMNIPVWPWHGRGFKKAWRHIWSLFDREGANEYATWVFNPNVAERNGLGSEYYPGDDVVDWIGLNGYNHDGQGSWADRESVASLFSYPSRYYLRAHPTKPQMICETGMDNLSYKPEWVQKGLLSIKNDLFALKGFSTWSEKWSHNRIRNFDSKIDSSPDALAAYREGLSDPYFIGAIGDRL